MAHRNRFIAGVRSLSWVQRTLLFGGAILLFYVNWRVGTLTGRVIRDGLLYLLFPLGIGLANGRRIGWRVDRRAVGHAVVLSAFVAPFYLLGSTLPSVRAFYPMWRTSPVLGEFLPHALQLFVLALATETYYRGFLCVGLRELGAKCILISPLVYAALHAGKPPIELLLSGPTDVLFGAVDYRANSILPSVVAHGFGLVLLDWLVLHEPVVDPARAVAWLSWLPVPI